MRCDSHVHVIGPIERYPQLPNRHYLAGVAELATLQHLAASSGIERFVIVQPSFYGADNTVTLAALDALGDKGRGVAVVEPDTPAAKLKDLHRRGVRGLRINLYSIIGNTSPLQEAFAAMENLARDMNWHVEVIAPLALICEHIDLLARSRAPVVIDHYGVYGDRRPDSAEGRALLNLLARSHAWIKLSAPYRVSPNPLEIKPDPNWLKAILAVAEDRCVWGSDWPHTPPEHQQNGPDAPAPYRALPYKRLVDEFTAAVGSAERVETILSGNPSRLYGFADS